MRVAPFVAGAVLVVALAGCAGGAVIKPTVGAGSPFCNHVSTFATQAAALNDAATQNSTALLQIVPGVATSVKSLANEAPKADTVNGKSVKTDLGTIATAYQDLVSELQHTSDARAALAAVNAREGQALTDAVGRFDSYASGVCKVGQAVPSLPGSSTTTAPGSPATTAGPTAPTT